MLDLPVGCVGAQAEGHECRRRPLAWAPGQMVIDVHLRFRGLKPTCWNDEAAPVTMRRSKSAAAATVLLDLHGFESPEMFVASRRSAPSTTRHARPHARRAIAGVHSRASLPSASRPVVRAVSTT